MAKSGLKSGIPSQGSKLSFNGIRKEMNAQAWPQQQMARASKLNLAVDGNRNARAFKIITINGVSVKRYLS